MTALITARVWDNHHHLPHSPTSSGRNIYLAPSSLPSQLGQKYLPAPHPPSPASLGRNVYLAPYSLPSQLGHKYLPPPSPANLSRNICLPLPSQQGQINLPSASLAIMGSDIYPAYLFPPQPTWAEISTCPLPSQHGQRYLPARLPSQHGQIYLPCPPQPTWAEISTCPLPSQHGQRYLPAPSPANKGRYIYLPPPQPTWALGRDIDLPHPQTTWSEIPTCPSPRTPFSLVALGCPCTYVEQCRRNIFHDKLLWVF